MNEIEVPLKETLREVAMALEITYGREEGPRIFIRLMRAMNARVVQAAVTEKAKTMPTTHS